MGTSKIIPIKSDRCVLNPVGEDPIPIITNSCEDRRNPWKLVAGFITVTDNTNGKAIDDEGSPTVTLSFQTIRLVYN